MKRSIKTLLFIFSTLLFGLIFNFGLHRQSNKVIAEWKQDDSVHYKSFDPYYLSVVEGNIDWSFFLPGWEHHYYIFVGRGGGKPDYGHSVEFSLYPDDYLEPYLKRSKIEWTDAGVTFKQASGHILFIPKEMFVGGR